MTREWKPGDVVGHREFGRGVLVEHSCHNSGFLHVHGQSGFWDTADAWRPLVVIDPEDREQVELLGRAVRDIAFKAGDFYPGMGRFADALQAALREFADPKPPIEEPTGLGALVERADGRRWTRRENGDWTNLDATGRYLNWATWEEINEGSTVVAILHHGTEPLADWERDLLRGESR